MSNSLGNPLIFVFNFGKVVQAADLRRLADAAGADWVNIQCNFTHENPNAEQARVMLRTAFDEIMQYAETGIDPT